MSKNEENYNLCTILDKKKSLSSKPLNFNQWKKALKVSFNVFYTLLSLSALPSHSTANTTELISTVVTST